MQRTLSCPSCYASFQADNAAITVQCPSCGHAIAAPQPGPNHKGERDSGGVFIMGALLLLALIVGVILFWSGLLRKPQKRGEGSDPVVHTRMACQKNQARLASRLKGATKIV